VTQQILQRPDVLCQMLEEHPDISSAQFGGMTQVVQANVPPVQAVYASSVRMEKCRRRRFARMDCTSLEPGIPAS
jgi:hypothetical protein